MGEGAERLIQIGAKNKRGFLRSQAITSPVGIAFSDRSGMLRARAPAISAE